MHKRQTGPLAPGDAWKPERWRLRRNPAEDRLNLSLGDRNYLHLAPVASRIAETVQSNLAGNSLRVLDLGCGRKPYAPLFARRCKAYIGVDIERTSAAEVLAVGRNLPFLDGIFDAVLCTQVLEHDPEPEATISEAHRVLRDGGTLILSAPGVWIKHGRADYWRWTDDGLRKVMHAFRRVEVHNCGGQYSALFQILNLYVDPLPFGRRLIYLMNNVAGLAFDRVLRSSNLIVNYVVLAGK